MAERKTVIGWDIGGAHVKAARLCRGEVVEAAQWPCRLWLGLHELDAALAAAATQWSDLAHCEHAVTMTGEMVDLFADREQGVQRLTQQLAARLPTMHVFAGDAGWVTAPGAAALWRDVASANWLATARHCAQVLGRERGLLIDIGSTTTDIIAFGDGGVLTAGRSDLQRLRSGELVYHGVVRTPLCALARRIEWQSAPVNVMNEFFATTADVYRITGELDAAHDQQPSADNAGKELPATRARLARMIGLDAREGSDADWLAFARAWRSAQCAELREQVARVAAAHRLDARALVVGAGCGAFLVPELVGAGWRCLHYGRDVARVASPDVAAWTQVAAPAVAVAALRASEVA